MEFSYLLSYIGGSITFIIVTFCGEFLFSLNYKRKDKFVLRYSLSLLITLSLSVALTIPYYIVDVIYKENSMVKHCCHRLIPSNVYLNGNSQ